MINLQDNIKWVREAIAQAALSAGRSPGDITLVAVTKGVSTEMIREGIGNDLDVFGENRVQEAECKIGELGHKGIQWHMIGHLQTNKVKRVVEMFDFIQSVDSMHLAVEIDKRAAAVRKRMPVLLEVNLAKEVTKSGFSREELFEELDSFHLLSNLWVRGLMMVPPWSDEPEDSRRYFKDLTALKEEIEGQGCKGIDMDFLSMGMSNDFEVAIQEGANIVRIGTAIFGARSYV